MQALARAVTYGSANEKAALEAWHIQKGKMGLPQLEGEEHAGDVWHLNSNVGTSLALR